MENQKASPANSCPLTPLGFLDRAATVYGDCPSVIYNDTTYTWSQTHRRCLQLASSLSSLGIKRGDVVSVIAPNIPAMYELYFAVPFTGAVLNSINTRLDARTASVLLLHSESKLIFVDVMSLSLIREAISLFPSDRVKRPLLVLIQEDEVLPINDPINIVYDSYEELLGKGDPNFKWVRPETELDPITLSYTSGTTSDPKGVVHCHKGAFIQTVTSLVDWSIPSQPVYLWTLPMFHANGWSFPWGMAAVGGTNICLRKVDPSIVYGLINKHRVTHMCGAPVVLNLLSNSPNEKLLRPVDILTGGAPPPAAILTRIESLGFLVTHGYGLTETGGVVISCAWKPQWNRFPATERAKLKARQGVGNIGLVEVDVLDPDTGERVKRDGSTIGEIVLRGGCVMLGYLKDPEGTSKCMRNGWFYTGDIGVMHPDGYLEIKDRSKDVIISGGENLSSVEVESVLYTNPAVNEAAVVARPDEFWGETPCAFISFKDGIDCKPSEREIIEYCRKKLPHYMVPKTVVIEQELPKTATGKIQKHLLRDVARGLGPSRVSRM
ncbi:acyl-activating enzyme 5 peroxisomal [Tripterygium wilfordii]|uniref:Acyl-activating enzyme 5 peroxisomal n=1 Tax=Tripterygium wilfordii TaxID=458696 RepID=A0A7J7CUN6_TRIWF|nr:probable acyl-activating enzyme 5, peroxisomal [Tripterygium wilfordii]KAF5737783.1 acyl-activating enzyme 5 peroxisomal [Tripterygium wilfordii]